MIIQVAVPHIGESITEGLLVSWFVKDGDVVKLDTPLFELETDKITMTINSEHAGRLKILVDAGTTVQISQKVAEIDTAAHAPSDAVPAQSAAAPSPYAQIQQTAGPSLNPIAGIPQVREKLSSVPLEELAPSVRRLAQENNLDLSSVAASGKGGRLTKEDVVRHISQHKPADSSTIATASPNPQLAPTHATPTAVANHTVEAATSVSSESPQTDKVSSANKRQTRIPISPLRQRIAERLVLAKNETALLTTFNEADMSRVMALRQQYRDVFKEKHNVALGFMSFFVKAVVDALLFVPQLNAQIQGNEIVQNHFYDIGVAVGTERGLVVPVIRDCEILNFAEIEKAIATISRKVRDKTISLNDLSGGVFTISNGGIYGSLLSTPILNPPQSGILGMHAIKKRPIVGENDEIVVRPMMYLALSYDHRIVDGREAVTFLKRIVDCIENPERMMLEI